MNSKYSNYLICYALLSAIWPALVFSDLFIVNQEQLKPFNDRSDIVLIASTGRSGSTLLTGSVESNSSYIVYKTHVLPPEPSYKGKILFIFSNPDKSAESALHITLSNSAWGYYHFCHLESSDHIWLRKIGDTTKQTEQDNLLSYDALGCYKQLSQWLYLRTSPSTKSAFESQILAIKYENLWDRETIQAIKEFLGIDEFVLPVKNERGYALNQLDPREIIFRKMYNLGTRSNPKYSAYDEARALWEIAPPFQFYTIKKSRRQF